MAHHATRCCQHALFAFQTQIPWHRLPTVPHSLEHSRVRFTQHTRVLFHVPCRVQTLGWNTRSVAASPPIGWNVMFKARASAWPSSAIHAIHLAGYSKALQVCIKILICSHAVALAQQSHLIRRRLLLLQQSIKGDSKACHCRRQCGLCSSYAALPGWRVQARAIRKVALNVNHYAAGSWRTNGWPEASISASVGARPAGLKCGCRNSNKPDETWNLIH